MTPGVPEVLPESLHDILGLIANPPQGSGDCARLSRFLCKRARFLITYHLSSLTSYLNLLAQDNLPDTFSLEKFIDELAGGFETFRDAEWRTRKRYLERSQDLDESDYDVNIEPENIETVVAIIKVFCDSKTTLRIKDKYTLEVGNLVDKPDLKTAAENHQHEQMLQSDARDSRFKSESKLKSSLTPEPRSDTGKENAPTLHVPVQAYASNYSTNTHHQSSTQSQQKIGSALQTTKKNINSNQVSQEVQQHEQNENKKESLMSKGSKKYQGYDHIQKSKEKLAKWSALYEQRMAEKREKLNEKLSHNEKDKKQTPQPKTLPTHAKSSKLVDSAANLSNPKDRLDHQQPLTDRSSQPSQGVLKKPTTEEHKKQHQIATKEEERQKSPSTPMPTNGLNQLPTPGTTPSHNKKAIHYSGQTAMDPKSFTKAQQPAHVSGSEEHPQESSREVREEIGGVPHKKHVKIVEQPHGGKSKESEQKNPREEVEVKSYVKEKDGKRTAVQDSPYSPVESGIWQKVPGKDNQKSIEQSELRTSQQSFGADQVLSAKHPGPRKLSPEVMKSAESRIVNTEMQGKKKLELPSDEKITTKSQAQLQQQNPKPRTQIQMSDVAHHQHQQQQHQHHHHRELHIKEHKQGGDTEIVYISDDSEISNFSRADDMDPSFDDVNEIRPQHSKSRSSRDGHREQVDSRDGVVMHHKHQPAAQTRQEYEEEEYYYEEITHNLNKNQHPQAPTQIKHTQNDSQDYSAQNIDFRSNPPAPEPPATKRDMRAEVLTETNQHQVSVAERAVPNRSLDYTYSDDNLLEDTQIIDTFEDGEYRIEFSNGQYEGEIRNNRRNGYGRYLWNDGSSYEGDWVNDKKHGEGIFRWPSGDVYSGNYVTDRREGLGTKEYAQGDKYIGEWVGGKKQGQGEYVWKNGDVYTGEFKDNMKEGIGVKIWSNGCRYEGEWRDDRMHGFGEFTWPEGDSYSGQYFEGRRHGNGIKRWASGTEYNGDWIEDRREGYGTLTYNDGRLYVGWFIDGKKHGEGQEIAKDGTEVQGEWDDGKLIRTKQQNE